jgi:ferrous iron transport protein B
MATAVMLGLIMLSWLVERSSVFLYKACLCGDKSNFAVPELPPYKLPSMAAVFHSAFIRTMDFLNKIKDVVIISSILVWFLSTFPLGSNFEHSYIAMTGKMLEPLGKLAGLNWRLIVALILGFFAKETTLSTLGILYHASEGLGNLGTNIFLFTALGR